ncbi:MAG: transposase [Bacillota bacterium]
MARIRRQISRTGFYHIMMRGNEKKDIFLDDEDRKKILWIISDKKKEEGFQLYAYCLMDNHVHLLLKTENISKVMKRINTSYVYYFNKKYNRVGHLFQDRYKSETIDDERHLLAVIRYIHNNPYEAGIVGNILEYPWSSYADYFGKRNDKPKGLVDTEEILAQFSQEHYKATEYFEEFSKKENDDKFIEVSEDDEDGLYSQAEARAFLEKYLREKGVSIIDLKSEENRHYLNEIIPTLKTKSCLSVREIAAFLDINRGVVQRMACQRTVP